MTFNIDEKSTEYLEGYCHAQYSVVWPCDDDKWVQEAVFSLANGYEGIVYFYQDVNNNE